MRKPDRIEARSILEALDESEWRTATEIASRVPLSRSKVSMVLKRMGNVRGFVEFKLVDPKYAGHVGSTTRIYSYRRRPGSIEKLERTQ